MFGFIRAAATALRAAASRAAKAIRKPFQRTPKAPEPSRAPKPPKAPEIPKAPSVPRTFAPRTRKGMEKLFYAKTRDIWEGLPSAFRNEAIMDALGVDSLEGAYDIVMADLRMEMEGELPERWETFTEEEQYDWAMSILGRR